MLLLRIEKWGNAGEAESVKDTDATRRKRGGDDSRHRCVADVCHFSPASRKGRANVPSGDAKAFSASRAALYRGIHRVFARLETRRLLIDQRDRETNVSSRCKK